MKQVTQHLKWVNIFKRRNPYRKPPSTLVVDHRGYQTRSPQSNTLIQSFILPRNRPGDS